jgi:hypothetical protein
MSKGRALVHIHDWRAHGLVAVPVSNGRLCFCTRRLRVVQKFNTGC